MHPNAIDWPAFVASYEMKRLGNKDVDEAVQIAHLAVRVALLASYRAS